ncbi:MAG TPA: helicase-related protein [Gemmatimonadales bacterium]|jgi:hypothetical protein
MLSLRWPSPSSDKATPSATPWAGSTRLCAETLAGIADPLFPALSEAKVRLPAETARAILAGMLEPLECPASGGAMPSWLLPHQADAVVRARAILQRFGGVLIADGVGLGKTFIALALAKQERDRGGDAVAFVPASLLTEWQRASASVEVPLPLHSHAMLARRAPALTARCSLILVDEAHAFRNPRTRRYDALARLAAGRRVALLTATPLNNTAADLDSLIHLFASRDRFREFGVADIGLALRSADPAATLALGAVSVCRTRRLVESRFPELKGAFPQRVLRDPARYDLAACYGGALAPILDALEAFARAPGEESGALLHLGLLRRLESSRAALRRSLARHRDILDEVMRAAEDGVTVSRAEVRSSIMRGADAGQLALWSLLSPGNAHRWESLGSARAALTCALALVDDADGADPKADALQSLLDGPLAGSKTIVFTEFRDTAIHLMRRLRHRLRCITVVGDRAWAGTTQLSRREALDGFAPQGRRRAADPLLDADVLIATDVASEGLNLQDARAIVSYDLPWNPVRVMQRIGRVERLHSPHQSIEVAHLTPAGGLRDMTSVLRTLRTKLSSTNHSLGAEPDPLAALWWLDEGAPRPDMLERESWRRVAPFEARERWRALAGSVRKPARSPVLAAGVADDDGPAEAGILLAMEWRGGRRIPLPFVALAGAPPRRDPEALGELAERALRAQPVPTTGSQFAELLASVMPEARAQLVALSASRRGSTPSDPGRQSALEILVRGSLQSHRERSDGGAFERAAAVLAKELPAGLDRLIGKLAREGGAPIDLAARIAELAETMMPPPGPPLDGTPKLVLVAAIVIAAKCPSR